MSKIILSPSLLSADFSNIAKGVKEIEDAGCKYIHLDVMDGNYVPNISFGPALIKSIKSKLFFDAHLMIKNPENLLDEFISSGVQSLCIHANSTLHPHRVLQRIKEKKIDAGLAVNPGTMIEEVYPMLDLCDIILIMSVNPGFGGQKMILSTLDKIDALAKERERRGLNFKISLDGGVNLDTIEEVKKHKVDILVAGSAFFAAKDKTEFRKVIEG